MFEKLKGYNQNYLTLLLIAFVSVTTVAIAYAALSNALTITTNKITQKGHTWNVAFDTTSATVTGTKSPSTSTTVTCGSASVTSNTVTIANTTLGKPDDQCTWDFTIKNTGSMVAVLNSLTANKGSTSCTATNASASADAKLVCDKTTISITDTSGGHIYTGSTIAASTGTQTVRVTAKYTTNTATPTASNFSTIGFTFNYVPQ